MTIEVDLVDPNGTTTSSIVKGGSRIYDLGENENVMIIDFPWQHGLVLGPRLLGGIRIRANLTGVPLIKGTEITIKRTGGSILTARRTK